MESIAEKSVKLIYFFSRFFGLDNGHFLNKILPYCVVFQKEKFRGIAISPGMTTSLFPSLYFFKIYELNWHIFFLVSLRPQTWVRKD